MNRPSISMIVARSSNHVIGKNNQLPWKISADLQFFKKVTLGYPIIMGRKTWESLPKKPLSNRVNVVISNTIKELDNAIVLPNIGRLKNADDVWVIGGSQLVQSTWEYIHEIHLTLVLHEHICDTFIDLKKIKNNFVQVSGSGYGDHSYEVYKKNV